MNEWMNGRMDELSSHDDPSTLFAHQALILSAIFLMEHYWLVLGCGSDTYSSSAHCLLSSGQSKDAAVVMAPVLMSFLTNRPQLLITRILLFHYGSASSSCGAFTDWEEAPVTGSDIRTLWTICEACCMSNSFGKNGWKKHHRSYFKRSEHLQIHDKYKATICRSISDPALSCIKYQAQSKTNTI